MDADDINLESEAVCNFLTLFLYYNHIELKRNLGKYAIGFISMMILAEYSNRGEDSVIHQLVFFFCISTQLRFFPGVVEYISLFFANMFWKAAIVSQWVGFCCIVLLDIYTTKSIKWYSWLFLVTMPYSFPSDVLYTFTENQLDQGSNHIPQFLKLETSATNQAAIENEVNMEFFMQLNSNPVNNVEIDLLTFSEQDEPIILN